MDRGFDEDLEFEWNKGNIDKNWKKHGVANKEAEEVFFDEHSFTSKDINRSMLESRYQILGRSKSERHLAIIFTYRKGKIRIISARPMNRKERTEYEKEKAVTNP